LGYQSVFSYHFEAISYQLLEWGNLFRHEIYFHKKNDKITILTVILFNVIDGLSANNS